MEYLPIIIMTAIGLGVGIWWGKVQKRNKARHKNMDEHKKRDRHKKRVMQS